MFCAFDGRPKILRLYGKAQAFHARDAEFAALDTLFTPHPSTRQLVDFHIELVQTSCGFGVPLFKFQQERDDMDKWLDSKNDQDIKEYWGGKMPSVWTACLLTFLDQNMNEENLDRIKAEGGRSETITLAVSNGLISAWTMRREAKISTAKSLAGSQPT